MKLTKTEFEILAHRLEVPDALADCLEQFDKDIIFEQSKFLLKNGLSIELDNLNEVQKAILIDCCEGSTFFADCNDAVASGELSKGKLLSWFRAAESLEKKLGCFVTRH